MIWLLELTEIGEDLSRFLPLLDRDRRARAAGMKNPSARTQSILAGLLLAYAYGREYGGEIPAISRDAHGKPAFVGRPDLWPPQNPPHFNLSHCDGALACALTKYPVGVDVQEAHAYDAKFRRILSESERVWVEEADSDARFTALWTRKEAYGKALGVGIGYELAKTDFAGDYSAPAPCGEGLLWTIPLDGCFLSVCAKEPLALQTVETDELFRFLEDTYHV